MAKGAYIGVGGVARKVKNIYVGVDGVARKVKKGYIGVNGVARLFYSSGLDWIETTMPTSAYWESIAYGNGRFVAVTSSGNVSAYSTDGIAWIQTQNAFCDVEVYHLWK